MSRLDLPGLNSLVGLTEYSGDNFYKVSKDAFEDNNNQETLFIRDLSSVR